jgi:hypothetical protein
LVFGHYFDYRAGYQALEPLVLKLELELASKLKLTAGTNLRLEPYPKSGYVTLTIPKIFTLGLIIVKLLQRKSKSLPLPSLYATNICVFTFILPTYIAML